MKPCLCTSLLAVTVALAACSSGNMDVLDYEGETSDAAAPTHFDAATVYIDAVAAPDASAPDPYRGCSFYYPLDQRVALCPPMDPPPVCTVHHGITICR